MAQQEVKRLVVGENSSCLICGAKDARYAVLDFNIFVCTFCAGIQYVVVYGLLIHQPGTRTQSKRDQSQQIYRRRDCHA
jgi:hypothetical protein